MKVDARPGGPHAAPGHEPVPASTAATAGTAATADVTDAA